MRRVLALLAVMVTFVAMIGTPAQAAAPGRNGLIVFGAETRHSGYELFTIRRTGADLTRITHVDGDAVHPDWSPAGTQIVFELDHPNKGGCSIVLMNADGSDLVSLTEPEGDPVDPNVCEGQPSFTPDGTAIVFGRFDLYTEREAIWRMDLASGNREEITAGIERGVTDPNMAPDGSLLTFIEYSGEDLSQAIASVRPSGTELRTVVPFGFDVAVKHDWAPNGRRIVFTDNADDFSQSANIATVRPDGTGLRYITHYRRPTVRAYVGGYSPNGNWIVFRLEVGDRSGLYRMHPDGRGWREIIPMSRLRPRFIDWGPTPAG